VSGGSQFRTRGFHASQEIQRTFVRGARRDAGGGELGAETVPCGQRRFVASRPVANQQPDADRRTDREGGHHEPETERAPVDPREPEFGE